MCYIENAIAPFDKALQFVQLLLHSYRFWIDDRRFLVQQRLQPVYFYANYMSCLPIRSLKENFIISLNNKTYLLPWTSSKEYTIFTLAFCEMSNICKLADSLMLWWRETRRFEFGISFKCDLSLISLYQFKSKHWENLHYLSHWVEPHRISHNPLSLQNL